MCEHPNPDGYTIITGNLNLTAGAFGVQASCAPGYEGTAVATPCPSSGPYSLSGCTAIVCTEPQPLAAYVTRPATNRDLSVGALEANVECAVGYGPAPRATACQTTGTPYELSGCERVFCAARDCSVTQMLKPNATRSLPPLGVAVTDEICCDIREGHCSVNRNATGNHTEMVLVNGVESYQVPCGSGYGLVASAPLIEKQTVEECCERLFCTAAACSVVQLLKEGYESLPEDGVDVTDEICCDPVEGMCGGNFEAAMDFDAGECFPWTTYRAEPNRWLSPSTDSVRTLRSICHESLPSLSGGNANTVMLSLGTVGVEAEGLLWNRRPECTGVAGCDLTLRLLRRVPQGQGQGQGRQKYRGH